MEIVKNRRLVQWQIEVNHRPKTEAFHLAHSNGLMEKSLVKGQEIPKSVGAKKRKQFEPQRSPAKDDPNFRGVKFSMNVIMKNKNEYVLSTPHYFTGISKRKPRRHSSDDFDPKQCASCGADKTPLWRDAEDGTPLCNACGIRYKKYRIRCPGCWRIPRKDENPRGKCTCTRHY